MPLLFKTLRDTIVCYLEHESSCELLDTPNRMGKSNLRHNLRFLTRLQVGETRTTTAGVKYTVYADCLCQDR